MVITEKYYPYPVLGGKAVAFNEQCLFEASFEALSNSKKVVVRVKPELAEPNIEALLTSGDAKLVCHVECPATAYRTVTEYSEVHEFKVEIQAGLIAKRVEVNLVIVAARNLPQYGSDSFIGLYKDRKFEVDQGGLLAVSRTFSFDVETKDSRMSDVRSPIQICPCPDESTQIMSVEMWKNEEIIVFLPQPQFKIYKMLDDGRTVAAAGSRNHDLLVSMVVLPALVEVLGKIAINPLDGGERDLSQYNQRNWYAPINGMVADYLKAEGIEGDLSTIDFDTHSPIKVAQYLAGTPLVNAFKRLEDL